MQREPDALEPGYAYLFALEGNVDALIDFLERAVDARVAFVTYLQVFSIPDLGLVVAEEIRVDPRFLTIVENLGFPPAE